MTGLRKAEQDGLWEGIKERVYISNLDLHLLLKLSRLLPDNFDDYWRVAAKITPTTTPSRPQSPPLPSSTSLHTRPPSADPNTGGALDRDGAYNVRNVPVRLYLPEGPVIQDNCPPLLANGMNFILRRVACLYTLPGNSNTLHDFLSTTLSKLFPPSTSDPPFRDLAYAQIQGVEIPGDADMAWLGACMAGADGWVNICIGIIREPRI